MSLNEREISWHPSLTPAQLSHLVSNATTYALAHGLCYLPVTPPPSNTTVVNTPPTSTIHAPFSLVPSPFPRSQFEKALGVQGLYNKLYARVAMDYAFLDEVLGKIADVDAFTGGLWKTW